MLFFIILYIGIALTKDWAVKHPLIRSSATTKASVSVSSDASMHENVSSIIEVSNISTNSNSNGSQVGDSSQIMDIEDEIDCRSSVLCKKCGLSVLRSSLKNHYMSGVCSGKYHVSNNANGYVYFNGEGYIKCDGFEDDGETPCGFFTRNKKLLNAHMNNHAMKYNFSKKTFTLTEVKERNLFVCGVLSCGIIFHSARCRHNHFTQSHRNLKKMIPCLKCNKIITISGKETHDRWCGTGVNGDRDIKIHNDRIMAISLKRLDRDRWTCTYNECRHISDTITNFAKHIFREHCKGFTEANIHEVVKKCTYVKNHVKVIIAFDEIRK
jgi:hypothetical protein